MPAEKQPTTKDMTVTLLEKVLVLSEGMAEIRSNVTEINRTIHNGMSTAIKETAKKVVQIEDKLEKVEMKVDNVISNGHPASCIYIKAQDAEKQKRQERVVHFSKGQKVVVWVVSLIGSAGACFGTWQALLK